MTKDALEQDNDTWQPISLAAGRVLQRLEEQRSDDEKERKPEKTIEQQREHERFVETRLIEIDRFERRYLRNRS
jgi:hypothetical protein